MKMKVCHFSSVHKVNDIRVFHKKCKTLASAGYDVTLIACAAKVEAGGVDVVQLNSEGGRLKRMLLGAFRAYKAAESKNADIYHFHDPELLPYGFLLKKKTGAKVVYDSHECYPDDILTKEWIPLFLRKVISVSFERIENFFAKRLDAVVAATPHIEKRFKGIAKRTVTINNYPLKEEFLVDVNEESVPKDGVCYVGAISHVRGILSLMDALDFVDKDIKFYLAGTFASPDIEAAVKSHRNWGRVTYYGQIGRKEISGIYRKSFAGIVNFLPSPNHVFSQPNKLFEYMSAGMPVVCSNFDLWRTVVEAGECGICVDPSDPKEIGEAINRIHQNHELQKNIQSMAEK